MCMTVSAPRDPKRTRVYKVVRRFKDTLVPIYHPIFAKTEWGGFVPSTAFQFIPGKKTFAMGRLEKHEFLVGDEKMTAIEGGAIHVGTSAEAVSWMVKISEEDRELWECEVDPSDWVADGKGEEACYKAITLKRQISLDEENS